MSHFQSGVVWVLQDEYFWRCSGGRRCGWENRQDKENFKVEGWKFIDLNSGYKMETTENRKRWILNEMEKKIFKLNLLFMFKIQINRVD